MPDFLHQAPISEADQETIRNMGVDSPLAMMGVIQASPDAFPARFGDDTTQCLVDWLEPQLTAQDREILARPVPEFSLGAFIDRPTAASGPRDASGETEKP